MKTVLTGPLFFGVIDGGTASADRAPPARVPKPLPFEPGKLRGLSERLLTSHHANNYGGAVKNLIKVEDELAHLPADASPVVVGALRERALQFHNSMTLHEAYFANLGGDGKQAGAFAKSLPSTWESAFRAAALSLGGGSGWVTLSLHLGTGEVALGWSGHHTQSLSTSLPLLVLDMYEHAYALDYGAAAAKYVDAFFSNLHWAQVEARFEAAHRALKAWSAT